MNFIPFPSNPRYAYTRPTAAPSNTRGLGLTVPSERAAAASSQNYAVHPLPKSTQPQTEFASRSIIQEVRPFLLTPFRFLPQPHSSLRCTPYGYPTNPTTSYLQDAAPPPTNHHAHARRPLGEHAQAATRAAPLPPAIAQDIDPELLEFLNEPLPFEKQPQRHSADVPSSAALFAGVDI